MPCRSARSTRESASCLPFARIPSPAGSWSRAPGSTASSSPPRPPSTPCSTVQKKQKTPVLRNASPPERVGLPDLAEAARPGCAEEQVGRARLDRPAPGLEPQEFQFDSSSLVLVADGVEYAGNLGTLIRTVDAARADCLVLTSRRARVNHPSVYTASRGMVLSTPVLEFDDIAAAAGWLRRHEFEVHLADPGDRQLSRTGVQG